MKISLEQLQPYIDQRLISVQKHPQFDLWIYNYTQIAQYANKWDATLKMCRGLILDGEGTVIARPFDKFFNVGEREDEPMRPDYITARDKADGSLGISYRQPDGTHAIATRGSFVSEQAIEGTKMFNEEISHWATGPNDQYTYLFEIIYPENRIVLDYGGQRKLVALAARHIESGKIVLPEEGDMFDFFEAAPAIDDFQTPRDNAEGVVLYYADGYMCKIKYAEYVRLHRLITGVTARRIWDLLRNNEPVDELLVRVPEEFSEWVLDTIGSLTKQFATIKKQADRICKKARKLESRKEQAELILTESKKADVGGLSGVVFAQLDKKPADEIIWKLIRPVHEVPFTKDVDL